MSNSTKPTPDDRIVLGLNRQAMSSVDAYIQYHHIVADAPDDPLMTPDQLAVYMKQVAIKRAQNRIYVTYVNTHKRITCRSIGPESKCFCGCTYKRHDTDSGSKQMRCMNKACECRQFEHIPVHGSIQLRCRCKHVYTDHSVASQHTCNRCSCQSFDSPQSCSCGDRLSAHVTLFETRQERIDAGKLVENLGGPNNITSAYAALGGLTNFSSLLPAGAQPADVTDNTEVPARRGKLSEADEMALYASNYNKNNKRATPVRRPMIDRRTPPVNARASGTGVASSSGTSGGTSTAAHSTVLRDIANEYNAVNNTNEEAVSCTPMRTPAQSIQLREQIKQAKLNAERMKKGQIT